MMEVLSECEFKITGVDSLLPPIAEAFKKEKACQLKPLPFAAAALLAVELRRHFNRTLVLVTESPIFMDEMRRNLETFSRDAADLLLDFPPLDNFGADRQKKIDPTTAGERLRTLAHLSRNHGPFLLNTSIQALMQKTISPSGLKTKSLSLTVGSEHEPGKIMDWLERSAYDIVNEVQERGQAARRGGLIDAWPPSEPCPLRIEFDGTELTSIRRFDPADQRSVPESHKIHDILLPPAILSIGNRKSLAACARAPARELGQAEIENHKSYASLVTHLPADTIFFWVEKCGPEIEKAARKYAGIACHADLLEKSAADAGAAKQIVSFRELTSEIAGGNHRQCFSVLEYSPRLALKLRNERSLPPSRRGKAPLRRDDGPRSPGFSHSAAGSPAIDLGFEALASMYERMDVTAYRRDADTSIPPNADTIQENRQRWLTMLETKARRGMKIHLFFDTPGALERFRNAFEKYPFKLHPGVLTDGFLHDDLGLGVIAESFIFRPNVIRRQPALKQQPAAIGRAAPPEKVAGITDLTDIEPGDLVVHANHGIGKYLGLYEMVFNGKLQETLTIEYAGRTRLYVPAAQANLVSRYFTAGGRKSKIHRIGGSQWSREKLSAEKAIYSLASSLLETQALRETISGFAFPRDVPWQHDFEASFFYEETDDQEKAIADVKADMESNVPMDRLICGDAGYGKTEVAMRAAFKAVMAGKQVAVLVPTTVLALQHYEVFQQRMASYPLRVELLCRFRSGAEQHRVAGELKKGLVDIVIGTHRLLQPDIAFKDIGLIIIDEEQRFGVEHKEYLKHLKKLADVLTLTATPIPRTLYMSLTGARRISMIQTPPKDRLPIETIVAKNDERLVREAILHEVNRGGQVFYLHNRVASMETARTRLQKIVPEARIAIAHGQMSSRDLATTMHEFGKGAFDVLLCTTIVESGVDLPNVNTILIDRADRFGIADLYQLRGRVGRSGRKAYAYLFTPVHGYLLDISRRRLGAVLEHNKLGSGFKLAMMDLEIRGAGNLLGPEQSGYISAIGFDLYCQLLRRTIEYIKSGGKPSVSHGPPSAALGPPREVESMLATPVAVEVDLDFISLAAKSPDPASAAFMPAAYIEDEETRIKVYRKIASAVSLKELESLRGEFKDRFGPLPEPFERLLKIAAIRVMASAKNITTVESKQGKLMLRRKGEYLQVKNQFPRLRAADADGKLGEIIAWLGRM